MRSNADAVAARQASDIPSHCMIKVGQSPQPCKIDRFWRSASVLSIDTARVRAQNHVCAVFSRAAASACLYASVLLPLARLRSRDAKKSGTAHAFDGWPL